MRYTSLLFLPLICVNLSAKSLPELKTKQSLDNIRLISNEGKFTYYQQRSGTLNMSTNYSNNQVMTNPKGTSYLLTSTPNRKKITIEVLKDYHKDLNFFSTNQIYTIEFGKTKPEQVAEGRFPKLHVKDNWLSYYHPLKKRIFIKNLLSKTEPISIKLKNTINPYFIPEVLMPTPDTVLYSDINSEGYMAVQMYTISDQKFQTVYKSKFTGMRIDFCRIDDNLYIGEFSYDGVDRGSSIMKVPIFNNKNFKSFISIYQSQLPDIGHITCSNDSLFFIKTLKYNSKINARVSEAVEVDLKENKVKILTDLKYVTNIVNMDGMILIPFRNRYYVGKGESVLNADSLKGKKAGRNETK